MTAAVAVFRPQGSVDPSGNDMLYRNVCVESFSCELPAEIVTSADIEQRLHPLYERLGLPEGRLELMSGIRERRFFPPGTRPSQISCRTAARAIEESGIPRREFGALIHGSVCRDQLEPATACGVHSAVGLGDACLVLDLSNACLGLLNGMLLIADLIECGRIRAGVVVGTEIGRGLVEGTIDSLLADSSLTRQDVKSAFASLTIGSGSAAIVLCHQELSRRKNRLLGGALLSDTEHHELCAGGIEQKHGDDRPRMQTDSEALLHAGVELAQRTWEQMLAELDWSPDVVDKVVTHQVGRAHRKLLLEKLEINPGLDFPTVDCMGNTGAVALPTAAALAAAEGHFVSGDRVALLGIGSGLNAIMLGIEWQDAAA